MRDMVQTHYSTGHLLQQAKLLYRIAIATAKVMLSNLDTDELAFRDSYAIHIDPRLHLYVG